MKHPSYLYGTVHINHKEVFNVSDSVLSKLAGADAFANEINMDSISLDIEEFGTDKKEEKRISEVLDKDELKRLDSFLRKKEKISLEDLHDPAAFEIYIKLSYIGYDNGEMNTALDGWLYNIARNYKKKIFGLENTKESFEKMKDIPLEEQHDMIMMMVDKNDSIEKIQEELIRLYLNQDISGIARLIDKGGSVYMNEVMINGRNDVMKERMLDEMKTQSCFFAVGAAHLPGDKGLISLLIKEGYEVKPVISPKTGFYKKFTKENTELQWEKFTDKNNGYSVEMPGEPGPLNMGAFKMQSYVDIGTGIMYFSTAVPSTDQFLKKSNRELLKYLENNFAQNAKTSNEHTLSYKGLQGVEMDILKDGINMRIRLLHNDSYAYLFMLGLQNFQGSRRDFSDRFFNSVDFFTPDEVQYTEFTSDSGAYVISVPGEFKLTNMVSKNNLNTRTYSSNDNKNGITVVVSYSDYGYGRYFNDLDNTYSFLVKAIKDKVSDPLEVAEVNFAGYPAREIKFSQPGSYGKIIYVIRDSRLYSLVVESKKQENAGKAEELIGSFRFIPYLKLGLKKYTSSRNDFTVLFPSKIHTGKLTDSEEEISTDDDSLTNYYYGYDPFSSASFYVICEHFSKYYYTGKNDSAYFKDLFVSMYPDDSISAFVCGKEKNTYSATAKVIFSKNNYTACYTRFVLNGDALYTIACYLPPDHYGDSLANVFRNSFRLTQDNGPAKIFSSRLKLLLNDLHSADTSKLKSLHDNLSVYETSLADTAVLMNALATSYADDTSSEGNTRHHIYDRLFETMDDSIAAANYVAKYYSKMGTNPLTRTLALTRLAEVPREENYKLLKQYLPGTGPTLPIRICLIRYFQIFIKPKPL